MSSKKGFDFFSRNFKKWINFSRKNGYQRLPQNVKDNRRRDSYRLWTLLDHKRINASNSRCRNIFCSCCLFLVVLILFLSSIYRPGPSFYNKEELHGGIFGSPECIVIVPVTVSRTTYNNTLHHLELSLTEPCHVIISEDTAYWQQSDSLVLDYVKRNPKWIYAKHAAPLYGIFAKASQWLRRALSSWFKHWFWAGLKEIVILPSVNAYTIHFYDLFFLCFNELNLPYSSMLMVLEDDIEVRHDAIQFGRWVSKKLLANNRNYWALSLQNMQDAGQAIYSDGQRVRTKDNYDVFLTHRWSTWGYALTKTQWETWWHKGYPWWTCWDSTLRKTMKHYDIPVVISGLVRSYHSTSMGTHSVSLNCKPWVTMDLHAQPITLNYAELKFSPRIRSVSEPGVPSVERDTHCDKR